MKKKVIQIVHDLSNGGAENIVYEYCLKLNKDLFDLILICLNRKDNYKETRLISEGVKIYFLEDYIEKKKSKSLWGRIIHQIKIHQVSKKIIRKEKPNIIHSHLIINSLIAYAMPEKGTKIIHTVHSDVHRQWSKKIPNIIDKISVRLLIKKYDVTLIALHDKMKQDIIHAIGKVSVVVIHDGIDLARFENIKDKNIIKKSLKLPDNKIIIGSVGRFDKVKNYDFLFEVYKEYKKINDNSFLLIVGSGDEKESFEKKMIQADLQGDYIILENRNDVPEIMRAMDVMLLTSFSESFSLVTVEAQLAGTKCIVSDVVPRETKISNLVLYKSINESASEWARQIDDFCVDIIEYSNIEKIDMKHNILKLERIYLQP